MSGYKSDYIAYRSKKAWEALHDAKLLDANYGWNACINRLYYACYYSVSALLLKNDLPAQTHNGVKTQFNQHFIKTGMIAKELGKLYTDLMDARHKGDYGDMFDFTRETVEPLLKPVEEFVETITDLINH